MERKLASGLASCPTSLSGVSTGSAWQSETFGAGAATVPSGHEVISRMVTAMRNVTSYHVRSRYQASLSVTHHTSLLQTELIDADLARYSQREIGTVGGANNDDDEADCVVGRRLPSDG
jgi:hypothetical protein